MNSERLNNLLENLLATWENEVVEFKRAGNSYKTDKIGEYFSALANEANLRDKESAWLIFGIDNKSRKVCGTDYRLEYERLQGLKMQIAEDSQPSITFRNIYELHHELGRVVFLEIPPAPLGIPIAWKGHYHARAGESLTNLSLDKLDEIRQQAQTVDWSAQTVDKANIDSLDVVAVDRARKSFAIKHANRIESSDVMSWPISVFLDRAKLTREGAITRAALLLLGKSQASHLLSPHPAQITWKLEGEERAYEHFSTPFLLSTTLLYRRIRNIQLRLLPQDQLLPIEISKYDQRIVLEALHNCIAHQDYASNSRIVVIERTDRLEFISEGGFYDGQPSQYYEGNRVPRRYRNPFLAQAMTELNMIDTMGYGIHDMYTRQAKRYFPMPDYDLDGGNSVKLTIPGRVVDPAYTRMLILKTDLPFSDVLALDRVQKQLPIDNEVARRLRRNGLIEGRKPNLHVSASVAMAVSAKPEYIKARAQNDEYYCKLIKDYLEQFGKATRREINELLFDKLSTVLDSTQKLNKISNIITKMRRNGVIINHASRTAPEWRLVDKK